MKKNISVICTALSALLFFSCGSDRSKIQEEETAVTTVQETQKVTCPVTTAVTKAVTKAVTEPDPNRDPYYPVLPVKEDELPVIGSTNSVRNLAIFIKQKLCNSSLVGSWPEAVSAIISDSYDLIMTESLSESELQEVEAAGVHINFVPVAREALVFMVNKENPVNSLTSEQIRGIYSGQITNWSEIGGNDEEIAAYQHRSDTENQLFMGKFMKGYDFPKATQHGIVPYFDRTSLYRCISQYNNDTSAIGYTVFSDAVLLCENSEYLKIITVDGVAPSEKTVRDGTYPLSESLCVVYKDNPQEKTQKFINWLLSESGQKHVQESSYFPVNKITEPLVSDKLYEPKGTGKKMPENYSPSKKISVISGENVVDLSFVKNEELRKMIQEDLDASVPSDSSDTIKNESVSVYGENGYITFRKNFTMLREGYGVYHENKYFTYDLTRNKRIEKYSDLFFENTDFVPLLNKAVSYLMTHNDSGEHEYSGKFIGITGDIEKFSVEGIELPDTNENPRNIYPYIFNDAIGNYSDNLLPLAMVTGEYHDFHEYISIDDISSECEIEISEKKRQEWYFHHEVQLLSHITYICYDVVNGSLFHSVEEIKQRNDTINKIIKNFRDKFNLYFTTEDNTPNHPLTFYYMDFYHADNIYNVMADCTDKSSEYYTATDYYMNVLTVFRDDNDHYNNLFNKNALFDHHYAGYDQVTGDPLTFADIFGPEFSNIDESYAFFTYSVSAVPDGSDCVRFYYGAPFDENYEEQTVEIPIVRDHLNMKYFIPADEALMTNNSITNKEIYEKLINYTLP